MSYSGQTMSSQRSDEIKLSTATNAYHVSDAIADAAATKVSDLSLSRAKELMTLAYGVGISIDQSTALVAAKLEEWSLESWLEGERVGGGMRTD